MASAIGSMNDKCIEETERERERESGKPDTTANSTLSRLSSAFAASLSKCHQS